MAILKCKMCGGDIVVNDEKTFGTCEYCGSTMTLPKVSDDQRAARFNRGNHFRRQGEFDKALAVYESIVREDDADAEAHWCCALCRFGIEYVEDPNTFEFLPTCHRASFDSFLEDVDYLAALDHSDGITKRQYQKDAAKIAEVQRGILATSQNEEPFDVFICYKETDDSTKERTRDSLDAQDIYYQLTQEGYRVFFARITLEDKAGTEYEPYIFAALNSAKVMVALGSKPEYFNAVWVKNEWSRFLAMMRKDRSKLLLPCYKDMDPYDLPEQLGVLQSYDMAKIGFMQDLIRGIKKVLRKDEPKKQTKQSVSVNAGSADIAPLLKRMFMYLEDSEWDKANEYAERVLDKSPENAEAYLGKLMTDLKVRRRKDLKNQSQPFDYSKYYGKAIRFADKKTADELTGYITYINTRNKNETYNKASRIMESAKTEGEYKEASGIFKTIPGWKDADKLAAECDEKAEVARKDAIYNKASRIVKSAKTEDEFNEASKIFKTIPGWKDADKLAKECAEKAEALHNDPIYSKATSVMKSAKTEDEYNEASKIFKTIPGWKDADKLAKECAEKAEVVRKDAIYDKASRAMRSAKTDAAYEDASKIFKTIPGWKDADKLAKECDEKAVTAHKNYIYDDAVSEMNKKTTAGYLSAKEQFKKIPGYKDADRQISACDKGIADLELSAKKKKRRNITIGSIAAVVVALVVVFVIVLNTVIIPNNIISDIINEAKTSAENGNYLEAIETLNKIPNNQTAKELTGEYQAAYTSDLINKAKTLADNGQYTQAANKYMQAGLTEKTKSLYWEYSRNHQISAGYEHTVGLKSDGTVIAVGYNGYGQCGVKSWKDIVSVSAGSYHTVGLKSDGTVVAVGDDGYGQCGVKGWKNIVAVSAGYSHTVGLKSDGTVVAVGDNIYGQCDVKDWKDIIAVSAGISHTVGLKSNGTVVALGKNDNGKCNVSDWKDIVAVAAGTYHTVGLKSDGTVVAVGFNDDGRCDVKDWKNIVAVSAGNSHTVGLKSDGTVVAVGSNDDGQCDVKGWTDIVAVSAGRYHTVGLKADGTVVAVGSNGDGKCNVSDWKLLQKKK
ncbi:MAG: TIR domain-containing protein [Ruminococcus sp.]|nr:TIR domain-containing protein [Ruminococcus sp.]